MANFEHFASLPTVRSTLLDGGTLLTSDDNTIKTLLIGTAGKGLEVGGGVFAVGNGTPEDARTEFGLEGTLVRGMYEYLQTGTPEQLAAGLKMVRVGSTPATLEGVGARLAVTGYTIETTDWADNTANSGVALIYQNHNDRLRVYVDTDEDNIIDVDTDLVYDNLPGGVGDPGVVGVYDTGAVVVTGTANSGVNLGSEGNPVFFAAVEALDAGTTLTEGTDGTRLSRMELYEALHKAYNDLENEDVDMVIPMDVYLDEKNIQDLTDANITSKGLNALTDYPTAEVDEVVGSDKDYLGLLYTQEYNGKHYFWWDTDRDGVAEIFPTVGSASATANADGTALTSADFHEVNFAYQLATYCFKQTYNNSACVGVVGVRPPDGFSPSAVSTWVGKLPTYVTSGTKQIVSANGTGLLGNKFMAGRKGNSASGLPSFAIDGTDGLKDGGFIATDTGWLDDTQRKDANDKLIDIGKYISVVAAWPAMITSWSDSTLYTASGATGYAGLMQTLPISQAPTNQNINVSGLPFDLSNAKHNDLASKRYVTFRVKPKGLVVTDAPTAARPGTDYARLSTFRVVKAILDEVRVVADPFIGKVNSSGSRAALETAVESKLNDVAAKGVLRDKSVQVTATPQQQVNGDATLRLKLTPNFELRNIDVIVSLSAL